MKVTCPNCKFTRDIKDELIPEAGRKVTCSKCKEEFPIKKSVSAETVHIKTAGESSGEGSNSNEALRSEEGMIVSDIKLVSAACPNCGGALQLPENKKVVYCSHCGSSIVVQEILQRISGSHPKVENLIMLAEAAMETKDYPQANQLLVDALKIDKNRSRAWIKRAICVNALSTDGFDRTDEIIKYIRTGISCNPTSKALAVESLMKCAGSAMNDTKYQQAHDLLAVVLEIDRENASAWVNQGICVYNLPADYDSRVNGMLHCMKTAVGYNPEFKKLVSDSIYNLIELPEKDRSIHNVEIALTSLIEAYYYNPENEHIVDTISNFIVTYGYTTIEHLIKNDDVLLKKRIAEKVQEVKRKNEERRKREEEALSKKRLRTVLITGSVILIIIIAALCIKFFSP
jgi:predicted Zn finger-like uncharacterized protein